MLLAGCTASWQAPLESRSPPSRPPPLPADAEHYRVVSGDTLHGIAWRAGADWRSLARWNGLGRPYTIYPGQVLRIKPPPARRAPPRTAPPPPPRSNTPNVRREVPPTPPPKVSPSPRPKPEAPSAPAGPLRWAWPTDGSITSTFARADPARKGIKIAGEPGQDIRSAEAGDVVYSGSGLIGYGRLIIIKHNENYLSAYGHNRKLLVKEGDRVAKGERIAEMGESNAGRAVLHFEIRRDGKPIDPALLLPRR